MSAIHPDDVLNAVKARARPQKQRNLDILHQVCAELHRLSSRDFSLATIGRLSEERGGPARCTLYNAQAADFRALIRAWADYAGEGRAKRVAAQRPLAEEDLLRKVEDPALRALLGAIVAERNRLRAEVTTLRAHANIVIDRRVLPGEVSVAPDSHVLQILPAAAQLLPIEHEALEKAISPEFLEGEGWREGPNGEILNAKGRKLFDLGFATALRKMLAEG